MQWLLRCPRSAMASLEKRPMINQFPRGLSGHHPENTRTINLGVRNCGKLTHAYVLISTDVEISVCGKFSLCLWLFRDSVSASCIWIWIWLHGLIIEEKIQE